MKKLKIILTLMLLVFFSSSLFAQVGVELETAVADFQSAYNKSDNQALSKMFSSNAVRINTDGTTITGAKKIGDSYGSSFNTATLQCEMKITNTVIESETKAIITGTYSIIGNIKSDGDPIESKGNFENIYLKENDVWKISKMKMHD